jgi:signal transduction histidine kinase
VRRLSLSARLSLAFALLLVAFWASSAWLQVRASRQQEQEAVQRLSYGLAEHIAQNTALVDSAGLNSGAVRNLFHMLMVVNPSVEVYLLGRDGHIESHAAPQGRLRRDRVNLEPVRRFLAGAPLPILGDDPRGDARAKVFSAAPLRSNGRDVGYVYVVLHGEAHDALSADAAASSGLRSALWSMALVGVLALAAGVIAFRSITRPLRALTHEVQRLDDAGLAAAAAAPVPVLAPDAERDEIAVLRHAFAQMAARIARQWHELVQQDQQRRELVANISHDLRTPLTSLHGYLETMMVKADQLDDAERRRYLETALSQSRKVGQLAQQLFELARLEYGAIKLERESFSLADLLQDLFHKFELAAESRQLGLTAHFDPDVPAVNADFGMIERVLTNLLDNAIRHTPPGGEVRVELQHVAGEVSVQVSDTGPGIPAPLRADLFQRPSVLSKAQTERGAGGLGLLIVQRILRLHGSDIRLIDLPERGAVFRFALAIAG